MDPSLTSITLLNRIRSDRRDEDAWREFVQRYGIRIYQWCLKRNLQPIDAEDVTQNVLLKLSRHLEQFQYDPSLSFRGWLRRVTENAIKDFIKSYSPNQQGLGGSEFIKLLAGEPARIELYQHLAEAFDLELLDEAKSRVQKRVNEQRWLSWDLLTNHAMTGKQVGEKLQISAGVACASKNFVKKLIVEEIEMMETGQ